MESDLNKYSANVNDKLLSALPSATRVLEIGCATGKLGARFKLDHPGALWFGVVTNSRTFQVAAAELDGVYLRDLNREPLGNVGFNYDCVVIDNALQSLNDPEALLLALAGLTRPDAQLVLSVPNSSHASVIKSLFLADPKCQVNKSTNRADVQMFSQSSLFKLLLDAGWWPTLVDRYEVDDGNGAVDELAATATQLGVPAQTALRNLTTYQWIVNCHKAASRPHSDKTATKTATFSVVVPVNHELIYNNNVMISPGLREVHAQIVACRGHPTAAAALREGLQRTSSDWIVFCHQDIYFPRGSGIELSHILGSITDLHRTVVGVAGIGLDARGQEFYAGAIVDRIYRYDWPAAERAISIDECLVVLPRETELLPDDELGWHLWATDLCLQAISRGLPPARIERLLIFHNSLTEFSLPPSYYSSAAKLAAKYPNIPRIVSLCGIIKDADVAALSPPPRSDMRTFTPLAARLVSWARRVRTWLRTLLFSGQDS